MWLLHFLVHTYSSVCLGKDQICCKQNAYRLEVTKFYQKQEHIITVLAWFLDLIVTHNHIIFPIVCHEGETALTQKREHHKHKHHQNQNVQNRFSTQQHLAKNSEVSHTRVHVHLCVVRCLR